jgi:hypothetical protein
MIRRCKSGPFGAIPPGVVMPSMAAMICAEFLQKRNDKSSDQISVIHKFTGKRRPPGISCSEAQTMRKRWLNHFPMETVLLSPFTGNSIVAVLPSSPYICISSNNRVHQADHVLRALCDQIERISSGDQIALKQVKGKWMVKRPRQGKGFCRGTSENLQPVESEERNIQSGVADLGLLCFANRKRQFDRYQARITSLPTKNELFRFSPGKGEI